MDAILLLDVLLAYPKEPGLPIEDDSAQYKNGSFQLLRLHDDERERHGNAARHIFTYDLFHLQLGFVGSLTDEIFERMSAEIRNVHSKCKVLGDIYSTSERLGKFTTFVETPPGGSYISGAENRYSWVKEHLSKT